jgi:hypothetical protein
LTPNVDILFLGNNLWVCDMSTDNNQKILTPEEFAQKVKFLIKEGGGDNEVLHSDTDDLMEDLLIALGYEEGIELIRNTKRWYA